MEDPFEGEVDATRLGLDFGIMNVGEYAASESDPARKDHLGLWGQSLSEAFWSHANLDNLRFLCLLTDVLAEGLKTKVKRIKLTIDKGS